jgi:hypothetical protein
MKSLRQTVSSEIIKAELHVQAMVQVKLQMAFNPDLKLGDCGLGKNSHNDANL